MRSDLDDVAARIHDILRAAPTSSPQHRALHAKGTTAIGVFHASGELDGFTTTQHLLSGSTPATLRFSHPGGDPAAPDPLPSARGLAVKLRAGEVRHDLVAVSSPAFVVRDGDAFIELLMARSPDPATGAPDPAVMGAFLEAHPEALPAISYALTAPVPLSYATLAYRSLHTFLFVDNSGERHPFRFSFVPTAGTQVVDADSAGALGDDYLAAELAERAGRGAATFDLVVQLGEPGDPTGDPTAVWPERPTRVAGRLEVTALDPGGEKLIFDPTNVPPGVELPDDDEILALRRAVYSLSYATRSA